MGNYEQYGYSKSQYYVAFQVYNYFSNTGWTDNAIFGMLGNMVQESSLTPASWQNGNVGNTAGGMGLVQWTPGTKLLNWCNEDNRNLNWEEIHTQCQFIEYELNNGEQWQENSYQTTFTEYIAMNESPADMAKIFCSNFEDAGDPVTSNRTKYANQWSEILSGVKPGSPIKSSNSGSNQHENQGGNQPITITIQSGDTLSGIAEQYGVTVQDILNWNPSITNPNDIYVGQQIIIYTNGTGSSSGGNQPITITIQSGDTLSGIAEQYGVTVQDILNWNPSITNPNDIYVGEQIIIY